MPLPQISDSGRPVAETDIAQVEKRFGCKLPVPYVAFLTRTNGGLPEPDAFPGLRPREGGLVHFFFAIDGGEHMDLVENAAFFREYHDVPATLLPIAATTSGDLVCIGIASENYGEVWFWSHDHPVREKATWLLARDLDTFLVSLYKVELEER